MTETVARHAAEAAEASPDKSLRVDGTRRRWFLIGGVAALLTVLAGFILATATTRAVGDARLGVPAAHGQAVTREAFLGRTDWPTIFSLLFLVVSASILGYYLVASARHRAWHPALVVFAALVAVAWVDPLGNWATTAIFDPQFLHFPTSWPWVRIAPGIEPVMIFVGYPFLFLVGALIARGIHRRLARSRLRDWIALHPVLSAGLVGLSFGVAFDLVAQLFMMRAHMYVYAQHTPPAIRWDYVVVPWLPVLYDSTGIAASTVLLVTGASPIRRRRQPSAMEAVAGHRPGMQIRHAWVLLSAAMLSVIAIGGILRATGLATSSFPGSWPFHETPDLRP
ncbi:MAG: spirocyclase AveC family protein [Acidimicrobiales bacterium]